LETSFKLFFADEVVTLGFLVAVDFRFLVLFLVALRLVVFLRLRAVLVVFVMSLRLMLPALVLLSASKESMPDDVEGYKLEINDNEICSLEYLEQWLC